MNALSSFPEQSTDVLLLVVCSEQATAVRAETLLRNSGWAARHMWVCDAEEADDALVRTEPDLVLCSAGAELGHVCNLARQNSPNLPVLALAGERSVTDDQARSDALGAGAADLVSLADGPAASHFKKVCERELQAARTGFALRQAQMRVAEYISRQRTLVNEAARALLTISEGIIVEANPAAAKLFGMESQKELLQLPLLDVAAPDGVTPLREQLGLLQKRRIADAEFSCALSSIDGTEFAANIKLSTREVGTELYIDALVRADLVESEEAETDAEPISGSGRASTTCENTVQAISEAFEASQMHGVMYAVLDGFAAHQQRMGLVNAAHLADTWEALLADALPAHAQAFRLAADELCVVMRIDTPENFELFARERCKFIAQQSFNTKDYDCHVTTSIAAYPLGEPHNGDGDAVMRDCCFEARHLSQDSGNDVRSIGDAAKVAAEERNASKQADFIRESLETPNRFHLAFQRISCLGDDQRDLYDVLVRLTDAQGNEWHAREFLPVAQRYGLMPAIDRWVFEHALRAMAKRRDTAISLMLRLAEESLPEIDTLLDMLREHAPEPGRIAVQLREEVVQRHVKTTAALSETLRGMNVDFVLDYYGSDQSAATLIEHVKPQYVKLAPDFARRFDDQVVQARLQKLLKSARAQKARVMIPFVENTRVMGELWQMGINYVQGNGLQQAEAVMLATEPRR